MPYATRQQSINFPKRKSTFNSPLCKISEDVKGSQESKSCITESASSSVRKAFHNKEGGIVGREQELKVLEQFLLMHLENQISGSLYISGLPGTGKTASVNYIIQKNQLDKKYLIIKINCTAFNSSKAVFKRICEELKLKNKEKSVISSINAIEKYLLRKHKMTLLILDEIDQLETKSQAVLYKLFEWPSWENSKYVLLGIANAMDLTDRNLPRLCAKVELKPTLLHFPPYTKQQIFDILKNRLTQGGIDKFEKMFSPAAVELISAKVAGSCGDVRRALDLGKRVIEIAEHKNYKNGEVKLMETPELYLENAQKLLKRKADDNSSRTPTKLNVTVGSLINQVCTPNKNKDSEQCSPKKQAKYSQSPRKCLGDITPLKSNTVLSEESVVTSSTKQIKNVREVKEKDKKEKNGEHFLEKSTRKLEFDVDSKDVMSVVKSAFEPSKNFKSSEKSSFPLHQKLLICSLLLITKADEKKNVNIRRLHQVYSKVCSKRGLTAVDKSGFIFLCRQVELTGIVQIGKGSGILAKISLQWDETEIGNSLKDSTMLSSILNDVSCLT